MDQQDIVTKLREKQTTLGIQTQAEIAAILGVTEATVSLLYSGKRQPGGKVLRRMLELWPRIFDDAQDPSS